jgi:DNA polymerase III sliding clamp (beta) subunit (PCNA family)
MINRHNLTVTQFADTESFRGVQDVRFTPTETIATNGHYLVRVTNPPSETIQTTDRAFSIPAEQLKAVKVKKGDAIELATNGTGSSWNLTTGTSTYHLTESENRFPNVDAVMPKDKPSLVIGFSASYLAQLAKAFAGFHDARIPTVKLSFYGPDKAAMFEATNSDGQKMTALLMPVRL